MIEKIEINDIIKGLVEEVGSNDVYDILDHLNISLIRDNPEQNPLLKSCEGMYIRNMYDHEVIIVKDDLDNERQIIAHELGHALLHTEYDSLVHNRFALPGRNEYEANYFAVRLLYDNINIKQFKNYTKKQIAMTLRIDEGWIEFLGNEA